MLAKQQTESDEYQSLHVSPARRNLLKERHDSPLAVVCFGENKGAGPVEYLITQLIEHMCTAANKTDLVVDLLLLSWEAV